MHCPKCGNKTKIFNSRPTEAGSQIWRRHKCLVCGLKFTTRERVDWNGVTEVASEFNSFPYERERLLASIISACLHQPKAVEAASRLCDQVEHTLAISGFFAQETASSSDIRDIALNILTNFDPAVGLRYLNEVYDNNPPLDLLQSIIAPGKP